MIMWRSIVENGGWMRMIEKLGMIDISGKKIVKRKAVAEGVIKLRRETLDKIKEGRIEKGDVISAMKLSAIMAVKNTSNIIPLTHPIPIEHITVEHEFVDEDKLKVRVTVKTTWKTGVEMDALTGVSAALLTIWDMVKKYEKDSGGQYPFTRISDIKVVDKKKED